MAVQAKSPKKRKPHKNSIEIVRSYSDDPRDYEQVAEDFLNFAMKILIKPQGREVS